MPLLQNGNPRPELDIPAVGGGSLSLPGMLAGKFGVVSTYRGAGCPFCTEQLAGFAAEKAALVALGAGVSVFSVDDEKTAQAFAEELSFPFALGHSASADQVSERVGASAF